MPVNALSDAHVHLPKVSEDEKQWEAFQQRKVLYLQG